MPETVDQPTEDEIWDLLISPQSTAFDEHYPSFIHLVHYCDFAALRGIISQKEVWLSPVALMNDYNELRKGQKLFKTFAQDGMPLEKLGRALQETQEKLFNLLSKEFNNRLDSDWTTSYVSCWSMRDIPSNEHDDLTMWRGYASEGNGVAIVIDHSKINSGGDFASEIVAAPVSYETEEDFALRAKECLEIFFAKLMQLAPKVRWEYRSKVAGAFGELCYHLAITHKHPGFKAEKEWRFIWRSDPSSELSAYLKPKLSADGLFERFCLPLKDDRRIAEGTLSPNELITSIMIGPCANANFKKQAVTNMLRLNGFPNADKMVTVSDIPFRGE